MADYLDTLQDRLVAASRRLSAQRRRRWRRRGGAATALVLVVGAPALAATGVWRPPIGNGRDPAPKITAEAPPADQLALLGVLRRPQTAADRGAATLDALKFLGRRSVTGVRTDSIRLLSQGPRDRGLVLVPVARYQRSRLPIPADTPPELRKRINPPPVDDALCLFQLDEVDGAGVACWSSADIHEGRAWMSLGHRAAWIVPDGVATVRTTYPAAPVVETTVRDNLALFTEPKGRHGDQTTTFLDAQGVAVRVIEPPKPPPHTGFPAEYEPVPPGSTHTGGVRRIAVTGSGLDARYQLLLAPPKRRGPAFISLSFQRPACAGKQHLTVMVGGVSGRRVGLEVSPSTGDFDRARWCPGTYRGSYRLKGERKPFGTFSFRVRPT